MLFIFHHLWAQKCSVFVHNFSPGNSKWSSGECSSPEWRLGNIILSSWVIRGKQDLQAWELLCVRRQHDQGWGWWRACVPHQMAPPCLPPLFVAKKHRQNSEARSRRLKSRHIPSKFLPLLRPPLAHLYSASLLFVCFSQTSPTFQITLPCPSLCICQKTALYWSGCYSQMNSKHVSHTSGDLGV